MLKILITGGSGFIGSALAKLAISLGHKVINLDALTYAGSSKNLLNLEDNPNYFFEHKDIVDLNSLEECFKEHMPDAVMHLAAESHVDRSIEDPAVFINTNIIGTFNLLEVSRNHWEKRSRDKEFRFLHVSTDEVFGSLVENEKKFIESSPYAPNSPYSSSKAASDHLVRAWFKTYDLPVLTTNCSNNYGPYQNTEKLIPSTIIKALSGEKIPVYGKGQNIRDWLYVEDHVKALMQVLTKGKLGRMYNIGGNNEVRNIDLVKKICNLLKKESSSYEYSELIEFVDDRPGHDRRYAIDSTRIMTEIGWQPEVDLEKGLKKTIDWYISNKDWWVNNQ